MNQTRSYLIFVARVLIASVFLINGFGIVSPAMAIHDMVEKGIAPHLAELLCIAGRIIDILCGVGFIAGTYQRVCTLGLILFLIPATLIAHSFWSAPSSIYHIQLVNFFKNLSIVGGLLLVACNKSFGGIEKAQS